MMKAKKMNQAYAGSKVARLSVADLQADPQQAIALAKTDPVQICDLHGPCAYLLSAKAYEALLERLDDAELVQVARERLGGETVTVSLDEL